MFARDVYKLNLHYYDGDYSPINMPGYTAASGLANNERYDLFNGNISSMAVNIRKLATVANSPGAAYAGAMLYNYRYDQLNRLMEVDAHATNGGFCLGSALPHTPLPDYKERYSYDPNGNIKSLFRNGTSGTYAGHATPNVAMDNLTYKYQYATTTPGVMGEYTPGQADPTDLGHYTNRLASVQDPTNLSGNYAEDIDNQAALNYTYDASGNRISKTVTPPSGGGGAVITWYVRDAQGNVMSTYVAGDNSLNSAALTQTELHVYGRRRIGVLNLALNCSGNGLIMASTRTLTRGQKFFELTNHLGNVLATVTDRLIPMPDGNGTVVDYYLADVASATDYYAFGMQMPGRGYSSGAYRYGFNGKENDNEVKGQGNQQDYGMRIYDGRLGKFLSVDPLSPKYPELTPYQFASNRPIDGIDLDGMEYLTYTIQINLKAYKSPKITSSYYVWNNANQHNTYGNLGPGVLYRFRFYVEDEKKYLPDEEEFVSRGATKAHGLIKTEYGNYMGATGLLKPFFGALESENFVDGDYDYVLPAVDFVDFSALQHDIGYDKLGAVGANSLFGDLGTTPVDLDAWNAWNGFEKTHKIGSIDPISNQKVTREELEASANAKELFEIVIVSKRLKISKFMAENYKEAKAYGSSGSIIKNYKLFLKRYMEKDAEGNWTRKDGMWKKEGDIYVPNKPKRK